MNINKSSRNLLLHVFARILSAFKNSKFKNISFLLFLIINISSHSNIKKYKDS